MSTSSSGSIADLASDRGGSLKGTIPTFVVGLAIVVVAGVLVGPRTESYVAVAFVSYFLTTVYDLVVERLGYRDTLLAGIADRADG